jgi:hypothetical protein
MIIDVDAELARIKEKKHRKAAAGEGRPNGSAEGKPGSSWRERVSDAAALQHMEFPPLRANFARLESGGFPTLYQ